MPMVDVYAVAGTFGDKRAPTRALTQCQPDRSMAITGLVRNPLRG